MLGFWVSSNVIDPSALDKTKKSERYKGKMVDLTRVLQATSS